MSKKVFTGERQNLPQLAMDVEDWLRKDGFEVQSGTGEGTYLIQARKQSTLRSILGNNQTVNVRIEGTPENYSIDVDGGSWIKNLSDSDSDGTVIVASLATIFSFGITTVVSASERSNIENSLWKLKKASCPACFKIGAREKTGEKFVRAEGITLQLSGAYNGTKIFTDTFKCKFCAHAWEDGEKARQVDLCPKCYEEKALASTGRKIITCKKTQHRSQEGQPLGEQVFTNTFRCNACSHTWGDGEHSQLVEACPGCLKTDTREATGEYAFSVGKTDQWSKRGHPLGTQTFTNTFQCRECSHEWNDGQHSRLVEVCPFCEKPADFEFSGEQIIRNFTRHKLVNTLDMTLGNRQSGTPDTFTERTMQVAIDFEAYIENWRCKLCSKQWNTGEKSRRLN